MNIADRLIALPAILQPEMNRFWQDYQAAATLSDLTRLNRYPQILASLPRVWACSPFVAQHCIRSPALLSELIDSDDLLTMPNGYSESLDLFLGEVNDENELFQKLRHYRRREMVRIAWRDLAGWASLQEILHSLSELADALLNATVNRLYQRLVQQWGMPCNDKGVPQPFIVVALGKLGGQELNFSSDIDLMFAYPEAGETQGAKRSRTNQEFFVRLGQQVIQALSSPTADGMVFRVDMRLRPFGDSGPLVMHFAALEDYYQTHGRDWERYAMVKARVCAGDKQAGQTLLKLLQPFVYRRYLDYNAFESLRDMKAMIDQETRIKGWENNVKLGLGGIREVEFICQTFQLIRGGQQMALQQRHLLTTLEQLQKYNFLVTEEVAQLREAYCFLRQTENHLQEVDDRQTQTLPEDELQQSRLAYSMGFEDWHSFIVQLHYHQHHVHRQFKQVIAPVPTEEAHVMVIPQHWQTLWMNGLHENEQTENLLRGNGFLESIKVLEYLRHLSQSYSVQKLSRRGSERLDKIIPLILQIASTQSSSTEAVRRSLRLVESIAQRSVYLALLIERPQVLEQLVRLCAESAWIAEQITRYPVLLDELLDPRRLYEPLTWNELESALQAQIAHLPEGDLEIQMDSLRQFKRAHVLRVATAEVSNRLTIEIASDYLTAIADTLIKHTLGMAWCHLTQRHGQPMCNDNGHLRPAGFCIVAYGKAGGIELSYGSDLDIVFLHDSRGTEEMTNGDRPLDNSVFFVRLAQRIIHIMSTTTPVGNLYEIDPRLRPGGSSGLLVSSLDAFESYQRERAWTWEHQALVRARAVAGDERCMTRFTQIRRAVVSLPRQEDDLKKSVVEMRDKMRANLDRSTESIFDLKQGAGGLTDIEFLIQYNTLRWAYSYPRMLDRTSVLFMLQVLSEYELLPRKTCQQLSTAYRAYRTEIHRLALQNQTALVKHDAFLEQRQFVLEVWSELMNHH